MKLKNSKGTKILQQIFIGHFCTGFIDFMLKGKSLLD